MDSAWKDAVLLQLWGMVGGSTFTPTTAWQALPDRLQRPVLERTSYRSKSAWLSAVNVIGRVFKDAADSGYRSAQGLSITVKRRGLYYIVRRGAVERIELEDKAQVLERCRRLATGLAELEERARAWRAELGQVLEALERDEGEGDAGEDAEELLGAVARAHGDEWRTLRQLGPIVGRRESQRGLFLSLVGRQVGGMRLEADRDDATGWRLYRVVLAD